MPRHADAPAASVTNIVASVRATSAAFDPQVDSWFDGLREHQRVQETLFAANPDTSSYPSGHTLWALLAAAWLAEDRRPPRVAYPIAAFVSFSRVHLRLHRSSDVVTTAAITAGAWGAVRRRGGRAYGSQDAKKR